MYTLEQKLEIVRLWYSTKSYAQVQWKFNYAHGIKSTAHSLALNRNKIRKIVEHLEKEKTLANVNKERSGRKSAITPEKREQVRESVSNSPKKSHRKRAQELNMSSSAVYRVMRKDMKLFPYKISTHHVLQDHDKVKRVEMCEWFNTRLERSPGWLSQIWFSDEAHFHLNGAVNNHNNVFWGAERPDEISEKRLKGPKVTAFVAFNARHGPLGPYWFEDEEGRTQTINSERYIGVIDEFHADLENKLTPGQLQRSWFMQDGARPHTSHASVAHLKEKFGTRLISLNTDHEWSPHSPDLNPLDFWFWGDAKNVVYANKPVTLAQLKENVEAFTAAVTAGTCDNVGKNFCLRLKAVLNKNGGHIEHIDFKKLN